MPPAIIAVVAAVATAVLPYLGLSAILVAILTVAIAIAAQIAISLGSKPTNQRTNAGEELKLKLDPGMPRQLPLGRCATGGSIVWSFTYGSANNVPDNAYLVRIVALSDLPINNLVGIFDGKNQLTFQSDPTAGLAACNQFRDKNNNTCFWVRVYKGTPTPVADANLVSWSGGQWTNQHRGVNMAYAITRALYDANGDAFPNGEPSLVYVVDGVSAYDQRQDGTRPNRTGNQRVDNYATWGFSRNAAVLAQQVLRGFYSNGVLLMGVQAEERDLDDAMLISAYNTCDETVGNLAGGTQPRYQAGYMINSAQQNAEILTQLQAAMDGRIIDRGGAITLRPGATHTPVFSITDDDVLMDQEKSWQPRLNLTDMYNFVDGVFVDESTIYNEGPFPPLRNTSYEQQDGGQRLEYQVAYGAVTNGSQVQRMTKRIHLQSRLQGTIAILLPLWAMEMEQDDWFSYTSARFGFTNKLFQAAAVDLVMTNGLCVAVVGREMDATIDGWNPAVDEQPRYDTQWVGGDPTPLPDPVFTMIPAITLDAQGVTEIFGIYITVTGLGLEPAVALGLEFQICTGTAANADPSQAYTLPGNFVAKNQNILSWGYIASSTYALRCRVWNESKTGQWSAWQDVTMDPPTIGFAVQVPTNFTLQALSDGSLYPASQVPLKIVVDVMRGGQTARLDDNMDYSIDVAGCAATIDNTDGSATKGTITVTSVTAWSAVIIVSVTAYGNLLPSVRITINKSVAAASGGGTSGGSSGGTSSKTANDALLNTVNSNSAYVAVTDVMTVVLAAGESLYGTGVIGFAFHSIGSVPDGTRTGLLTKWQYTTHGGSSWTDFPSGPKTGTPAFSGQDLGDYYRSPHDGSLDTAQTQSGLAAGTYDIRLVAEIDPGLSFYQVDPYGTMTITAKV